MDGGGRRLCRCAPSAGTHAAADAADAHAVNAHTASHTEANAHTGDADPSTAHATDAHPAHTTADASVRLLLPRRRQWLRFMHAGHARPVQGSEHELPGLLLADFALFEHRLHRQQRQLLQRLADAGAARADATRADATHAAADTARACTDAVAADAVAADAVTADADAADTGTAGADATRARADRAPDTGCPDAEPLSDAVARRKPVFLRQKRPERASLPPERIRD